VEFTSPGFKGVSLIAIANATGTDAPKTNVARSSLEDTVEQSEILKKIYDIYVGHISSEVRNLAECEKYSLTRAVGQIPYLSAYLTSSRGRIMHRDLVREALAKLPLFLLESDEGRKAVSLLELRELTEFWTVESPLNTSIENLIGEFPTNMTARSLMNVPGNQTLNLLPKAEVVVNLGSSIMTRSVAKSSFEITSIKIAEADRRAELLWTVIGKGPIWRSLTQVTDRLSRNYLKEVRHLMRRFSERTRAQAEIYVPSKPVFQENVDDYLGIQVSGDYYLNYDSPVVAHIAGFVFSDTPASLLKGLILMMALAELMRFPVAEESRKKALVEHFLEPFTSGGLAFNANDQANFADILSYSSLKIFNPFAWRREKTDEGFVY
jgi:hypothetical protein